LDQMLETITSGHCQLLKLVELTGVSRVGGTTRRTRSVLYKYIPRSRVTFHLGKTPRVIGFRTFT
jgi:hypothetical protein